MSVVNLMLQDLDRRQAPSADLDALPDQIRPLPPPARSGLRWMLGAAAALGIAGSAFAWWFVQGAQSPRGTPEPVAAVAQVPPPAPAITESAAAAAPAPAAAAQPAAQQAPADPPPAVPRTQPDDVRADSGPGPDPAEEERRPQRRKSLAMAMPGAPADAGAGHTRLEKHDRPSTPRERAERAHAQAATWLGRGEVGEAERSLREALREDAAYTAARQALVRLLAEQGRGEEARLTMLEGLSAAPQDVALAIAAARLLAQAGDAEGALRALDGAAQPGRAVAEFRGLRAAILQKLGKHAEAAEEYQAALRLAPDSAVWWMGLGLALEAQERPAEAREAFQRAGAGGTLPPDLAAFVDQKLRRLP